MHHKENSSSLPRATPVSPERVGIIWCNIGTPDAPTPTAVRSYLADFLSDPRIVELPRWLWLPVLHGIVLQTRSRQSARKYARIWTEEGSPLKVWTDKQAKLLQGWLGQHGYPVKVAYAMRYGQPSMQQAIERLCKQHVARILILPAYPQYSATTTASLFGTVADWSQAVRHLPEWRFVNHYHTHPLYIRALALQVQKHWQQHGRAEVLLMSFHGVTARSHQLGDPYVDECHATARLLAQALELSPQQYQVTFQSRFGRARWVQPDTLTTTQQLAQQGTRRVDIICPGFVADCLETLEEIAMECRHVFLTAGGKTFHYIPCLNDSPDWIATLGAICQQHLAGWLNPVAIPKAPSY